MRAMWTGMVSCGLLNIPVKLYPATTSNDISFKQVTAEGQPVSQKRVDPGGHEVAYEDICKGYDLGNGEYLIIDPEELKRLDAESTKAIRIESFAQASEIDPMYYAKPYYIGPDKAGDKGYALLVQAMVKADAVAIGKVCMRGKEYLMALRPLDGVLVASTMQYHEDLVWPGAVPVGDAQVTDAELDLAEQLIGSMTKPFTPEGYTNEQRKRVSEFIESKLQGFELPEPESQENLVTDLMDALSASIKAKQHA